MKVLDNVMEILHCGKAFAMQQGELGNLLKVNDRTGRRLIHLMHEVVFLVFTASNGGYYMSATAIGVIEARTFSGK